MRLYNRIMSCRAHRPAARGRADVLLLSLMLLAASPPPVEDEAALLRGLDRIDAADVEAEIQWRDGWDETYRATMEAWEQDLTAIEDEDERQRSRRVRELRLLWALAERFPEAEQRHDAVQHQAVLIERLGSHVDTGLRLLAERLDAVQEEDPEQALELLQAMHERVGGLAEPGDWPAFLAERVWALREAGHVAEGRFTYDVLRRRFDELRSQGRFHAARELLRRMGRTGAADGAESQYERLQQWVAFYEQAGLHDRAAEQLERMLALIDEAAERADDADAEADWAERRSTIEQQLASVREGQPTPEPPALHLSEDFASDEAALLSDEVDTRLRTIAEYYSEPLAIERLVELDERRLTTEWAALDAMLLGRDAAWLAPLREQQRAAMAELDEEDGATDTATPAGRVSLYRRAPWSEAGQRALLEQAERWLRAGALGLAQRSLRDVQEHAEQAELQERAQTGLALIEQMPALPRGSAEDEGALGLAAALPLPALTPRLAKHLHEAPTRYLAEMRRPLGFAGHDGALVLAAPTLLARYEAGATEPSWVQVHVERPDARLIAGGRGTRHADVWTVPGRFEPTIWNGRVVSRWGVGPEDRGAAAVAAFDFASGEPLWSTMDQSAWQTLQPISDPVVAEGWVYVLVRERFASLAQGDRAGGVGQRAAVALAALDAASGQTQWIRPVQWRQWTLSPEQGEEDDKMWARRLEAKTLALEVDRQRFDMVHFGNRVAVVDGAVYLTTGLGVNARLDARDGMIEWLRWHAPTLHEERMVQAMRRVGAQPKVVDDVVVFAPRDRFGAMALDRATGELVWDDPLLPIDGAVGRAGDTLVFHDEQALLGIDAATGEVRWHRRLDEPMPTAPVSAGRWCYAVSGSTWLAVAMDTGEVVRRAEAPELSEAMALGVAGGEAMAVTAEPALRESSWPRLGPVDGLDAARGETLYERAWKYERAEPELWPLPEEAGASAGFLSYAEGWLERIDLDAESPLTWSRPVPMGLQHHAWHDGAVVLVFREHVLAVDVATGERRWWVRLPFELDAAKQLGPYVLVAQDEGRHNPNLGRAAAIDLARGELAWDRELSPSWSQYVFWDEERERAYTFSRGFTNDAAEMLEIDLATGAITWQQPIESLMDTPPVPGSTVGASDAVISLPDDSGVFDGPYEVRFGREPELTRYAAMPDGYEFGSGDVHLYEDRWLEVRRYRGPAWMRRNFDHWLFDRGNPQHMLARDADGRVRGGMLYEYAERQLNVVDLASGEQVVRVDVPRRGLRGAWMIDTWIDGGRLYTVSTYSREVQIAYADVYLDVYAVQDGEHLLGQTLTDVRPRTTGPGPNQTQVLRLGSAIVVADMNAVHVFTPGDEPPPHPDDDDDS